MLLEIRIENLAVIERAAVRLGPGLNVLTGETGAGKSIIVGALGLLLGERASAEAVRPGAARALVEGVFDVSGREDVLTVLAEQGLEAEEGLLILRREVAVEGRNRAWANGAATTAGTVGLLGRMLVDLHGQHEHQNLLEPDEQRAILDAYAGGDAGAVAAAHASWRAARDELNALDARQREIESRADFLRFQLEELDAARLESGEEERLEAEIRRFEHSEELARVAAALHEELYAGDDALAARLAGLRRELERLIRIDETQTPVRDLLETAYFNLEEAGRRMGDYAGSVEHDPGRLETLRHRQDTLYRLLRKYGPGTDDALATAERLRAELEIVDAGDVARKDLERRLAEARAQLERAAEALTTRRREAVGRLAPAVQAILPDLGLGEGRFEVRLEPLQEIGPGGAEAVEFLVSLNRGFEPRPLARVASGGELSRVMLALKAVLAEVDSVPSLVFDEIDAGIGGRTAVEVAAKLRDVAAGHQVFAITHLAQIAARADQHLFVEKVTAGGLTSTRVTHLADDARVAEVARMLGGEASSATSLQHARELLGLGSAPAH